MAVPLIVGSLIAYVVGIGFGARLALLLGIFGPVMFLLLLLERWVKSGIRRFPVFQYPSKRRADSFFFSVLMAGLARAFLSGWHDLTFIWVGLTLAATFLFVWWKTGRILRYHLPTAIAITLVVILFRTSFVGLGTGDAADTLTRSGAIALIALIMPILPVAILDYRLLLDLRDIAESGPAKPATAPTD